MYNFDELNQYYTDYIKSQERLAISACLLAERERINQLRLALEKKMKCHQSDLHDYVSDQCVTRMKEGFEGKTAESAERYLKGLAGFNLTEPIRNVGDNDLW